MRWQKVNDVGPFQKKFSIGKKFKMKKKIEKETINHVDFREQSRG